MISVTTPQYIITQLQGTFSITTNIKTQRISGMKRGDDRRAHSDPLPGCFYISNTEDVALSSHQPCLAFHWSAGETGAACQKPFFLVAKT